MKKTIMSLILLLVAVYAFARVPDWLWATKADGTGNEVGRSIIMDEAGNSYVTGYFNGTATFGTTSLTSGNSEDIFVAKMDADGNWLWATKAGGSSGTIVYSIALDEAGNSYVTGCFLETTIFGTIYLTSRGRRDIFVAKMDADGNWLWATKAGGSSEDEACSIDLDEAGNSYVTGFFRGTAIFGTTSLTSNGESDIFVAKMDANGNWLWATQAGGSSYYVGKSIALDEAGNSYVTGYFHGTATFGTTSLTSSGSGDIFIAKMDINGNWLWATQAGGSSGDYGYSIAIDEAGNSYVTGYFEGTATFGTTSLTSSGSGDIFIAKMDINGNWQWATKAGGNLDDYGFSIAIDDEGNSYVTGRFYDTAIFGTTSLTSSGGSDIFVAKTDINGNWQWATKAGGSYEDCGYSITLDEAGNSYVTGYFNGTATFGTTSLTSSGSGDIFVAKLENDFIIDFSSPEIAYIGEEIQFTDASTGNPTTWEWDFENDGIYDSTYYSYQDTIYWTYENTNVDSVKLKISKGTFVDSLTKAITVKYCPLAPPDSVQVNIVQPDAIISWTAVDTTICGSAIIPDGYIILHNNNPENDNYLFVGYTTELSYVHTFVTQFSSQMFYRIVAFMNYSQNQINYLERLNNSRENIKWSKVKRNLKRIRNSNDN